MPIQAQTADGQMHEFPDGTPDTVVDKAMADYTASIDQSKSNIIDPTTGMTFEGLKHAAVIPQEAAKGVPVLGAAVPDSADTKQLEAEHPNLAAATRGVGTALALAPAMAAAPAAFGVSATAPILANVAAGAGTGAIISGADTAARGGSLTDIGKSAGVGALTGGAVAPVGKVLGAVFGKVMDLVSPETKSVISGMNPLALKQASEALKASGMTEEQIANKINELGPEGFLGEYSPEMKGLTKVVATMPGAPEGKGAITGAVEQRSAPQAVHDRLNAATTEALGEPQNITQLTLEEQAQRGKDATPLFQQFKDARVQPTPAVKALVTDLEEKVPGVFDKAKELANLKAAANPDQAAAPMENFFTTGERKDWPTTESYQILKEAIDSKIADSYVNGQPSRFTGPLVQIKKRLDSVISNANPEAATVWKQARDTWGDATSIMKAREAGTKVWDPGYTKDQLLQDVTDMTPAERTAHKEGARAALAEKANQAGGDEKIRKMFTGPDSLATKDKMRYLSGNKNYDPETFMQKVDRETGYAQTKKDIGTTTEKEAFKEQQKKLTPDLGQTAFGRMLERLKYGAHVTPLSYMPGYGTAQRMATGRLGSQFEAARNQLGPMMVSKGPQAQEYAKALQNYNPVQRGLPAGLNTSALLRALAQPQITRQPTQ